MIDDKELLKMLNKKVRILMKDDQYIEGLLVDWENEIISYEIIFSTEPLVKKIFDIERFRIKSISLIQNNTQTQQVCDNRIGVSSK